MALGTEVTFKKYVLEGIASGLTFTETMRFADWEDACDWAASVTNSLRVPFVILEMTNTETGAVETF